MRGLKDIIDVKVTFIITVVLALTATITQAIPITKNGQAIDGMDIIQRRSMESGNIDEATLNSALVKREDVKTVDKFKSSEAYQLQGQMDSRVPGTYRNSHAKREKTSKLSDPSDEVLHTEGFNMRIPGPFKAQPGKIKVKQRDGLKVVENVKRGQEETNLQGHPIEAAEALVDRDLPLH